jgi:hypothetical protein
MCHLKNALIFPVVRICLISTVFLVALLQAAMQKFVEKIVSMMKSEGLFEWQGGPIIMAQVNYLFSLQQPFHCSVISELN